MFTEAAVSYHKQMTQCSTSISLNLFVHKTCIETSPTQAVLLGKKKFSISILLDNRLF